MFEPAKSRTKRIANTVPTLCSTTENYFIDDYRILYIIQSLFRYKYT